MSEAYTNGWNAFNSHSEASGNPHYMAFEELTQDFYDWAKGWNDAEDAWYQKMDDDESADWQEYLANENSDDNQ